MHRNIYRHNPDILKTTKTTPRNLEDQKIFPIFGQSFQKEKPLSNRFESASTLVWVYFYDHNHQYIACS